MFWMLLEIHVEEAKQEQGDRIAIRSSFQEVGLVKTESVNWGFDQFCRLSISIPTISS